MVLPDKVNANEQTQIAQLLAMLGKALGANVNEVKLISADMATEDLLKKQNVILFGQPHNNKWLANALNQSAISFNDNLFTLNFNDNNFSVINNQPIGLAEVLYSPWNKNMTALIITGTNENAVGWAANILTDDKVRSTLDGEIATVDQDKNVIPINLHPNKNSESVSMSSSNSYLLLVASLTFILVGIGIIFIIMHFFRQRSKGK